MVPSTRRLAATAPGGHRSLRGPPSAATGPRRSPAPGKRQVGRERLLGARDTGREGRGGRGSGRGRDGAGVGRKGKGEVPGPASSTPQNQTVAQRVPLDDARLVRRERARWNQTDDGPHHDAQPTRSMRRRRTPRRAGAIVPDDAAARAATDCAYTACSSCSPSVSHPRRRADVVGAIRCRRTNAGPRAMRDEHGARRRRAGG